MTKKPADGREKALEQLPAGPQSKCSALRPSHGKLSSNVFKSKLRDRPEGIALVKRSWLLAKLQAQLREDGVLANEDELSDLGLSERCCTSY